MTDVSINFRSVFWSNQAYRQLATDFYHCHSKQVNLLLHWIGAGVQMWGAVQLLSLCNLHVIVYMFAAYVASSVPAATAVVHSLLIYGFLRTSIPELVDSFVLLPGNIKVHPIAGCLLAFGCGFLKDVGHHVCNEPAFMGHYMKEKPYLFFFHATWHLPFLIDAYSPFSTVKKPKTI